MLIALRVVVVLAVVLVGLWFLGPREPVGLSPVAAFPSASADLDAWLAEREANHDDLTDGVAKEIVWRDPTSRERTPVSIVYVHGFSATSAETRPFADDLAAALGANLHYTRLRGHGRPGEALAEATVQDWVNDTAEAIAIGQAIGERVVVIGTSTGGTLAAIAAADPAAFGEMAAVVMVSPNFRVKAAGSALLTMPFARQLVPLLVGEYREWEPHNRDHGVYWTNRYPNLALLPMAASVAAAGDIAFESLAVPAFFVFSDADQVVDASVTRKVASRWGGEVALFPVDVEPPNDPYSHVIAGDILSPTLTAPLVEATRDWLVETLDL